ncbi:MAG TPA: wax ester/triacylglycerol synthase domain-containing protein [Streptosporangiaceae bacterium]|nr:wax ester/triacylglycerol synthase domain-containing protein [Streptosporangiaceae bacterium]
MSTVSAALIGLAAVPAALILTAALIGLAALTGLTTLAATQVFICALFALLDLVAEAPTRLLVGEVSGPLDSLVNLIRMLAREILGLVRELSKVRHGCPPYHFAAITTCVTVRAYSPRRKSHTPRSLIAPAGSLVKAAFWATLAVEQLRRRRRDRSRPRWEMCFLPGLPGTGVGTFARMHHAIADASAAGATLRALLDTAPGAPAASPPPWTPARRRRHAKAARLSELANPIVAGKHHGGGPPPAR